MAKIVKDYGLVYNDDGSMCTTKRTDKIPFTGVTSFAVETATTNFLGPYAWEFDSEQALFYPSGLASGKTWTDCWDEKQKAYVGGQNLTCYQIYTRSIDLGSVQAAGTKITLSWKHKGYLWRIDLFHSLDNTTFTGWSSADTLEFNGDCSISWWEGSGLHISIGGKSPDYSGQPEQLLDRWYNVEITYTLPSDTRYIKLTWDFYGANLANGGLGVLGYIRQPQLEIKPFASSFVNGTRPTGRLIVPKEQLGFNPATDDWVVHYWKYPVATRNNSLEGYNQMSIGKYTANYSTTFIEWGKENGQNKLRLYVFLEDNTRKVVYSSTFDPNWYFRNWHHEVVFKNGLNLQYWVDGVKQCDLVLDKALLNNLILGLGVGGSDGNASNSYIANITYGKYTDQWTPEYIQRISAMTSTFYVPTKRVIV